MPNDQDWPTLRAHALGQLPYDHPTCDENQSLYGYSRDVAFCEVMYAIRDIEVHVMCCAKAKA